MKRIGQFTWLMLGAFVAAGPVLAEQTQDGTTVMEVEGGKIYRNVGPDGEVIYSDRPLNEQAEPIDVPKTPTYESKPVPRFQPYKETPPKKKSANPYKTIKVTYPAEDQVIRDNTGTMRVTVAIEPPLEGGDQLQLLFNGEVRYTGSSTTVTLHDVYRNTYTIVPRIIDAKGEPVASGQGVTFYMKQHSRNF
jgi:hypothetical protein